MKNLNKSTQELTASTDKNKEAIRKLTDLQLVKDRVDKLLEEQIKINEEQRLAIEQYVKEIDQLKITNKAFDISNKENFKNMNAVMEKMIYMSSERQKVKNEMDNIIQRRKSMKNLTWSNSFHHLPAKGIYPYNQQNILREIVAKSYCNFTEKKQDKHLIENKN